MNDNPVTTDESDDDEFERGDRVVIVAGEFVGQVCQYNQPIDDDLSMVTDVENDQTYCVLTEHLELSLYDPDEETPPFGMSSDDLANYFTNYLGRSLGRIMGVGHEQYDLDGHQKFEEMSLVELLDMLQEELQDQTVYAAMVDIKVERIKNEIRKRL